METTASLSNITRFARVVDQPESGIDLGEAALLIAEDAYPGLDIPGYLRRLDEMATPLRERLGEDSSLWEMVQALNGHLFGELGFRGNTEDYFDPRNSYLNEVLDRRLGIPITLSAVYIEVARRIGLTVVGIGLPGHFIVEARRDTSSALLDPFHGGQPLDAEDCERLVQGVYGDSVPFSEESLSPVRKRQLLARMLNNLKRNYLTLDRPDRAWPVIEKMLYLNPESAVDHRDRGLLAYRMNRFAEARGDLRFYLDRCPDAPDRVAIRASLAAVEAILQMMA
ncbi:MAG TPA: tetratricopeptide repeat protein [Thermoplasmata archaeon]|nr:tetratricopeptide repeat protein [Thermoplasmata archaeon]